MFLANSKKVPVQEFLRALDEGLDEDSTLALLEYHIPYRHQEDCLICDGIWSLYEQGELGFSFVASVIASDTKSSSKIQDAALNAALSQSDAEPTKDVIWAIVHNPNSSGEVLHTCSTIAFEGYVSKAIYVHPNVFESTKKAILEEFDNNEAALMAQ